MFIHTHECSYIHINEIYAIGKTKNPYHRGSGRIDAYNNVLMHRLTLTYTYKYIYSYIHMLIYTCKYHIYVLIHRYKVANRNTTTK